MLIVLFLVSHFNFLFVPGGGLSWLPVSFLLHVKYTLSYRIVYRIVALFWACPFSSDDKRQGVRAVSEYPQPPLIVGCIFTV